MDKIFVPFHDGLLDYNCEECSTNCCVLPGQIVANKTESEILLREHPFIRFFSFRESEKIYSFARYPPCWFLKDGRYCEIHRKYGYSAKPLICRVAPFYVYKCPDGYVVVPAGCSRLGVAGPGQKTNISYDMILRNAREEIDCRILQAISWPRKRLDLERRVLEESVNYLNRPNYIDYAAFQIAAATGSNDIPAIRKGLDADMNLWKSVLGVEDLEIDNPELTYEMTAITSVLRVSNDYIPNLQKMEPHLSPVALWALYLAMLLFTGSRRVERFIMTYERALAEIALGFTYLTDDDLRIKDRCLDDKLNYIRTLIQIYRPGFMKTVKAKGTPACPAGT